MKRILYSLMALVLGVATMSCTNDDNANITTGNPDTLTIGVNGSVDNLIGENGAATRIEMADDGNYAVWTDGDIIGVGVVYDGYVTGGGEWQNFSMVNIGEGGNAADFSGPYTTGNGLSGQWVYTSGSPNDQNTGNDIMYLETAIPHIFYGVAPATSFTMRLTENRTATLKSIQQPAADAFDGSAVLMTSVGEELYRLDRNNVDASQNTSIQLRFQHRTGFLKIKPGTLPDGAADDIVRSVKISAEGIAGTVALPFSPATGFGALDKSSGSQTDIITLDYEGKNITLGDMEIWVVALPGTYDNVDITIVTTGYDAINYVDRTGLVVAENTLKQITLNYNEPAGDNSTVATPTETIKIVRSSFAYEGQDIPISNANGTGFIIYNQPEQGDIQIDWQNIKQGGTLPNWVNTFAAANAAANSISNVQPLGKRIKRVVVEGNNNEIGGVASIEFGVGYVGGNSTDNDVRFEPKITGTTTIYEYVPDGDFTFFRWSVTNNTAMVKSITVEYEPGEPAYPGFEPGEGGDGPGDGETGEEIVIDFAGMPGLTTSGSSGANTIDGLDIAWRNMAYQSGTTYFLARNGSDNYIINTAPAGKRIIKVIVNCRSNVTSGSFDSRSDATVQFGTTGDSFVAAKSDTADGSTYVEEYIAPDGDFPYFKFSSGNTSANYESITVVYEPMPVETQRLTFGADALGIQQGVVLPATGTATVDNVDISWAQLRVQYNNGGWPVPLFMIGNKDTGFIKNTTPVGSKIVKITIEYNPDRTGNFAGAGKSVIKFGAAVDSYGDGVTAVNDAAAGTDEFTAPAGDFQYFQFTTLNASANYEYVHIDYVP